MGATRGTWKRLLPSLMLPTLVTVLASLVTAAATGMLAYYARQQQLIEERWVGREVSPHLELYFDRALAGDEMSHASASHLVLLNVSPASVFVTSVWASWMAEAPGFAQSSPYRFYVKRMLASGEAERIVHGPTARRIEPSRLYLTVRFLYARTQSEVHVRMWELEAHQDAETLIWPVDPSLSSRM